MKAKEFAAHVRLALGTADAITAQTTRAQE
jgi:hypothetical protein